MPAAATAAPSMAASPSPANNMSSGTSGGDGGDGGGSDDEEAVRPVPNAGDSASTGVKRRNVLMTNPRPTGDDVDDAPDNAAALTTAHSKAE